MAESRERDGILVLGEDEVLARGVIDGILVVEIEIGAQSPQFLLGMHAAFVDGHQLLVQMVERRPGRSQPVLEDGDEPRVAVALIERGQRVDREADVLVVFLRGEGARCGELVGLGGPVDIMPASDDDVVGAGKERHEGIGLALGGHPEPLALAHAGGESPDPRDGLDVLAPCIAAQIAVVALPGVPVRDVAVIEPPIVVGDDLEEIGNAAELRHRIGQPIRGAALEQVPTVGVAHHARLLRRGVEIAALAEGTVAPGERGVDGGRRGPVWA